MKARGFINQPNVRWLVIRRFSFFLKVDFCQSLQGFFRSLFQKKNKKLVKKTPCFFEANKKKTPIFVRFGPSDPHRRLSVWNSLGEVGTEALSSLGSRGIEALSASKQQAVQAAQAVTHSMLGNPNGGTKFLQRGLLRICWWIFCVYTYIFVFNGTTFPRKLGSYYASPTKWWCVCVFFFSSFGISLFLTGGSTNHWYSIFSKLKHLLHMGVSKNRGVSPQNGWRN